MSDIITESNLEQKLQAMTLEEKVSIMAGASFWTTVPVERLGIPAIKVSDGPNGARGSGSFVGAKITSACFPVGVALASSWDTDLMQEIGVALGQETKSKGAHFLLAPTVNIHRSPLNGRNFECFSEDPYLTTRMAVAYINGLQSENVGATIKHFVGNDSEFQRNTINSVIDERSLREIYLPPFEAAVKEGKTWAVMSSYNKVNGIHMDGHEELLTKVLKKEWGFTGIVMSDWTGTNSTIDAANNGLELEMPGPTQWRGEKLLAAINAGEVNIEAIDESVRRMLRAIIKTGATPDSNQAPERKEDRPEHRALIRRAASQSMVLLKNQNNILPLIKNIQKSIALIGPNVLTAQAMGGGSSQISAHYLISPMQGIKNALGEQANIAYELGCTNHKALPRVQTQFLEDGLFKLEYFNNHDLTGQTYHQDSSAASEQLLLGELATGVLTPKEVSARMTATFIPDSSGLHTFSLTSIGKTRLKINGQLLIDNWEKQTKGDTYFGFGSTEVMGQIEMVAGQKYTLELEYTNQGVPFFAAFRLGHLMPVASDAIARAVALAAKSDVALVFVGTNGDWETEGSDRKDMELPGSQNELVKQIAAVNKNTVVVLQTGSPVTMPWFDDVTGVLQAWFPGQECGNSISDVLFGLTNPSGKLTQTTPKRLQDNPTYINYPGENGRVRYGEGIFVGYRYYEKKDVPVAFPFGFGLSYTSFGYANLKLSNTKIGAKETITASIDITNTGKIAGQEVVQVYIRDVESSVARPIKELKAFAKVMLEPGQTKTIEFTLHAKDLAYWDDAQHAFVAEAGTYEIQIGAASNDIRASIEFELTETNTLQ